MIDYYSIDLLEFLDGEIDGFGANGEIREVASKNGHAVVVLGGEFIEGGAGAGYDDELVIFGEEEVGGC